MLSVLLAWLCPLFDSTSSYILTRGRGGWKAVGIRGGLAFWSPIIIDMAYQVLRKIVARVLRFIGHDFFERRSPKTRRDNSNLHISTLEKQQPAQAHIRRAGTAALPLTNQRQHKTRPPTLLTSGGAGADTATEGNSSSKAHPSIRASLNSCRLISPSPLLSICH